ncbi:MAG: hypothetical protein JOZ78_16205 [Chroococcidiopsidaceae cyanobacterium CP_BM_ER_R8_30]|nr:hypothetical protein [Chroococcidiopsidaceae cyanobacterium CP_BM_ER_R8_30]
MAIAKLKTGEIIEKPLEEMLEFIVENPDTLGHLESSRPLPKRRAEPKEQITSNKG